MSGQALGEEIRLEAEPMPDGLPGHARIVVTGSPSPPTHATYMLRREGYSSGWLGRNGWQSSQEALAPLDVVPMPDGWALVVGPEVSSHVMQAPYLLRLPHLNQEFNIFWPEIEEYVPGTVYAPQGSRRDLAPADPQRVTFAKVCAGEPPAPQPSAERCPAPAPASTPVVPAIDTDATRVIAPQSPAPNWKRPALILPLVALVIAAGVTGVFHREMFGAREAHDERGPSPPGPPGPVHLLPTPRPMADDARRPAWPEGTDGMTPNEVVRAAPDASGILRVAQRRQQQGRYSDAIPLLQTAAERGDAEAAFALARLYDPVGFIAGRPFQEPNAVEAARNYRDAVQRSHAAAAVPRAALRSFLDGRAVAGDREARDALAEGWP